MSSAHEPCLYVLYNGFKLLIIILYVDHLIIDGDNSNGLNRVKKVLVKHFCMKDLGTVHKFIGIRVKRDRAKRTIRLSQEDYISMILERFQISGAKVIITPIIQTSNIFPTDSEMISNDVPYRSAIGSLMYLMISTRPDIGVAFGLSQYCEMPLMCHWNAVKRVYRYV